VADGVRLVAPLALVLALTAACASVPGGTDGTDGTGSAGDVGSGQRPERFTIRPDDYHVPYAGTAEDGRRFFLSDELFEGSSAYVGLFLWEADGTFDSVHVEAVPKPVGAPIGQAVPAGSQELLDAQLALLGDYTLEPITVEPFVEKVDGIRFGWRASRFQGLWSINVEPGDFIAYYEPWDGFEYDT
jgi:hypothetical protein